MIRSLPKPILGGVDINSAIADEIEENWFSLILGIRFEKNDPFLPPPKTRCQI